MTSRFISRFVILFLLQSSLITLCFDRASCKVDFVKNEVEPERLGKRSDPSRKIKTFGHHSGYIPISRSHGARLFYYFFESRSSTTDPILLWLSEGLGYGSAPDLFYNNGPFRINNDLSLKWNDFGWDKACNLLYVDQPIGAGFSYSSDLRDIHHNSQEVSNDLYEFLQVFFQSHRQFVENDFYIVGHSYSGHTIPFLASQLHKKNKARDNIHINLKGFAIINGFTNPKYTFSSFPDFIYANKLVSRSFYETLKTTNRECLALIEHCQTDNNICKDADRRCSSIFHRARHVAGDLSPSNFKKHNKDFFYDFSRMKNLLSLDHVKRALGVGNRAYAINPEEILKPMIGDSMMNYTWVIPSLLEDGIKVFIFDGEYALACNWLGNLRWTEDMKWSGHDQFLKTKLTSYAIDGNRVGMVKNTGPLTFLKVLNSGSIIAMDQPYVSLQIIKNWMNS